MSDAFGPVLEFQRGEHAGTPRADVAVIAPGRTVSEAVTAAISQLPGWRLTTEDEPFAQALIAAGSTMTRRAFIMSCPLVGLKAARPIADVFTVQPLPTASELEAWRPVLQSWRDAFPPEHPDHLDMSDDGSAVAFFTDLIDGTEMGPLHRASCLLVRADGRALAGIVVNVRSGEPPWGGPWISDIWRDPSLRGTGIGPGLIDRAKFQLAEDGYTALTLAVTADNNAVRTYEREGFVVVMDSHILAVPES